MGLGDFAGVFEEMWCLHVVFCGQYVVESAVSLVSGPVLFRGLEIRHIFRIYFLMISVLGMGARRCWATGGLECMHLMGL